MITVVPIDWLGQGACLQPKNQKLHDLTVDYVTRELTNGSEVVLTDLNKVFVAIETDRHDQPTMVHGVTGLVTRVDIPLFRTTHVEATARLRQRLHSYLADMGYLGQEVFIHLSSKETSEQRCPGFDVEVATAKLVKADRYLVKVRSV